MSPELSELTTLLHREGCSCVILSDGRISIYRKRGVKDLYELLSESPDTLRGASVADKVVGKGAAALMILGHIKEVHADVLSRHALLLFQKYGVAVDYTTLVENIINRSGTGLCPVETLCSNCETAEECLPLISRFLSSLISTD